MRNRVNRFALLLIGMLLSMVGHAANDKADNRSSLLLLGTAGGPGAKAQRAGIASLITVNGRHYLIDAGAGVAQQLARAGIAEKDIPLVFLTHLHDDHTAGLAELMTFAFTTRIATMQVIGPPRTSALIDGAIAFLQPSAEIRMAETGPPAPPAAVFSGRDVQPGVIYQDENVQVTAVENSHYHVAADALAARNRSYALRFKLPDRVIVFTGDTGVSDNVVALAKEADILVSEAVTPEAVASLPPFLKQHMEQEHLSLAQVGELAAKAQVKMLVLSHISEMGPQHVAEIRRHFSGKVVIGSDLDRF